MTLQYLISILLTVVLLLGYCIGRCDAERLGTWFGRKPTLKRKRR